MKPKLLFALFVLSCVCARGDISLPKVFSSHMVLQRNMPIHVWGFAEPGEKVSVDFHGTSGSAVADSVGRWSVYLPAQPAGGPFTLTVRGNNSVQFEDILLGDLWVASGQSNMEMPLAGFPGNAVVKDADREIAAANYPTIRLLRIKQDTSDYPVEDLKEVDGWSVCRPDTARRFSAVAYFFARDIQQHQRVPIGLIDSTWGGSPAEAWTSLTALGADAALMPVFSVRAERMNRETTEQRLDAIDKKAKAESKPVTPGRDWHPDIASWKPAALFNAMIAPITPLPIRGVIWYQGETNSKPNTVELYHHLFSTMIQDWRAQWREGDFPFFFAQISGFNSTKENWGQLRDAQRRTLSLVNTGMAVTIDVGDEHNVHPSDKQTAGGRLALWARNMVYGEKVIDSGPLFRFAYPDGNSMRVWFDYAEGLRASRDALEGFEVAGANGAFAPASAKIDGDVVVVSCPSVPEPKYVRYAWANFPHANLVNGAGLPASTFTSYPVP
jgi:sialate O-acetylesterase